jgi:hypothetical protein
MSRGFDFRSYQDYSLIRNDKMTSADVDREMKEAKPQTAELSEIGRFPVRQMWTFNFVTTLLAQAIFDFHMG